MSDLAGRLAKTAMVPLWSSGFVIGTLATRHTSAMAVTAWRLVLAAVLMAGIAVVTRTRWPRTRRELVPVLAVGLFLQAVQFGGVYLALQYGISAGLAALLAGTNPVVVGLAATVLLDEHLSGRQWLGAGIGVAGVALAVAGQLGGVTVRGFGFALLGLLGLAAGTVVQRRYGAAVDLRAANTIQLGVGAVVLLPVAALTQGLHIPLAAATLGPLVWLALVNSIGAVLLFFWLLRREKSGEATSFLYLVPATTAIAAVPILHQSLGAGVVLGLLLAFAGVRLVASHAP